MIWRSTIFGASFLFLILLFLFVFTILYFLVEGVVSAQGSTCDVRAVLEVPHVKSLR